MADSLVIVESPAKARTLKKYLGKGFDVKASVGHVVDLPKKKLGVDVEDGFSPTYEVIAGKKKVINELKSAAKKAQTIFLAPDPDREGEAIAWHIVRSLDLKGKEVHRVLFNEITKRAVTEAIAHPRALDENKFEAQQARRILDRLVGYQISPLLWKKVRRGLSAGRVQSVAVRIVVDREREVEAFVKEEYWTGEAILEASREPLIKTQLKKIDGKKAEIADGKTADSIIAELRECLFKVAEVTKKERRQKPLAPFITSRLQQEAARKLRFTTKKTMVVAQRLYEGVELGAEGLVGLITYMRTDSTRVADEALGAVRSYIAESYGEPYLPGKPNIYKSGKQAQDAHEAIRPTSMDYPPERVKKFLEKDAYALYRLIWLRFVASQMTPALFDQTGIDIEAGRCLLRATGSVMKFDGFLKVYAESKDEDDSNGEDSGQLPPVEEGEELRLDKVTPTQHFTQPPPRFTEASLVRELEEKGIGRPSTYAQILSTIQDKEYVTKKEGRFSPTDLGCLVNDLLVESFPDLLNVEFTARMEGDLDKVEDGSVEWVGLLESFYSSFSKDLEKAGDGMRDVKREATPTDIDCEKCGAGMVIRWGRNGRFLACSAYPDCKNTKEFTEDEDGKIRVAKNEVTDEKCEKCGLPMVIRKGRHGPFMACSGYPDCKNTRPVGKEAPKAEFTGEPCPKCGGREQLRVAWTGNRFYACENYPKCDYSRPYTIDVKCPKCGGELVERGSKRKRIFYGCSGFPDCDFVSWQLPVAKSCPECGSPYLLDRTLKKGRLFRCPVKSCKYEEPADEV